MLRAIPLGIETVAEWLPGLMAGAEGLEPNQPELLESSALPVELYPFIIGMRGEEDRQHTQAVWSLGFLSHGQYISF